MAIPFRSNISVGTIFGEGNNLQLSHSNIRVNAGSNLNLSAGNSFNVTVNHDSHLTGEDLYFVGNRKCYLGYGGNQYTNLTLSSDGVVLLAKNLKIRIGETSSTGQGYLYCSSSDGTIITKTMPFGVQTVSDSDSTTSNTGSLSFDFYENDHTYQQMLELKYTWQTGSDITGWTTRLENRILKLDQDYTNYSLYDDRSDTYLRVTYEKGSTDIYFNMSVRMSGGPTLSHKLYIYANYFYIDSSL